jgi:sugar (pentulose or hexulose) kinase
VNTGLFPPVVAAGHKAGQVARDSLYRPAASVGERLAGAALASAGHDHLCAASGTGAIRTDQVLDSCGTAEALVRTVAPLSGEALAEVVEAGLEAGWHTVPGRHALLCGRGLGFVLERVLRLLGVNDLDAVSALEAAATGTKPAALRLLLGTPYGDASIVGLDADASPAALWSASLDAVAAGAAEAVQIMDRIAGPAAELVLSGGWAHSRGLRQRKAALLPRVRWPAVMEAGARGAALFGGVAAGLFKDPGQFPVPADRPL